MAKCELATQQQNGIKEHRQVYVGMHHIPTTDGIRRNNSKNRKLNLIKPKIFRWENGKKTAKLVDDSASDAEVNDNQLLPAPASERVKFILGGENEEEAAQENPQLFTELEELCVQVDGNLEWKETARWFKYEEDVEEGGDRWSKPHVATLSLYSLFELRSSLMAGTVILDMEAITLSEVADNVLDNLISCNKLEEISRSKVRDTLLRKHRHQRNVGFRRNLSNIMSGRKSFQNASVNGMKSIPSNGVLPNSPSTNDTNVSKTSGGEQSANSTPKLFRNFSQPAFPTQTINLRQHVTFERANSTQGHLVYQSSQKEKESEHAHNQEDENNEKMPAFLKKLPANAEASNILVGEVDFLEKPITAFVRLVKSAIIGDLTEVPIPTRFLFIMLGPSLSPGRYHEIGRAISTLMADDVFHDVAYKAKSRDDLIAGIDEFLEQVTVLPPGEWDPSIRIPAPVANGQLKAPRRCTVENKNVDAPVENFHSGGSDTGDSTEAGDSVTHVKTKAFSTLKNDFNIWKSREKDISDGLNLNSFGTAFFIYFLLLALMVTLGDHLSHSTGGYLGFREQILGIGISGLAYSIFSTQPLLIINFVVPLVLFDGLLYSFCNTYGLDYLPFRMWTGVWCIIFVIVYIACEFAHCVFYMSRFSLEIFVVLSPLVLLGYGFVYLCNTLNDFAHIAGTFENRTCRCIKFIYSNISSNASTTPIGTVILDEHLRDCVAVGGRVVGNGCEHDMYPSSMLLTLFTVILSIFLTSFKHFGYLPKPINHIIHSFTTFIVVCVMSAIACQFNVNINYLRLFKSFTPFGHRSSWFVPLIGQNHYWILIGAAIPAFFLSLIIFSEQIFTARHINRNSMILKKRVGYHLDIFLLLFGVFASSVLGLPFCVSSVVLSVNHIQSLTVKSKVEDLMGAFISIKEQRVSGFFVYVLIMLTPVMTPALRYIPHAVLHGVLLLALIRSFYNIQFAVRFGLLFMPKSHHPDDILYIRQVPLISANVFTIIQVLCTISLWAVRATKAAIVFPVALILLVGMRYLTEYLLRVRDVLVLDGPVPSISRRCCGREKKEENMLLMSQLESGLLSNEQPVNEDVIPDYNIVNERVNIAEELSKTAAWKQLMHGENSNSGVSNSPKIDRQNSRKRRKKRKESNSTAIATINDECINVQDNCYLLDHVDAPFKKEDLKDTLPKEKPYVGELKEKPYVGGSKERKGSKRKKPDRSKKNERSSSVKDKRYSPKKDVIDEPSLPPWEQPYHSPPRKDFGLLKIPENEYSVDPACSRSDSPQSEIIEAFIPSLPIDSMESDDIKKSLDSLDNRAIESNEESRYASSEPDD